MLSGNSPILIDKKRPASQLLRPFSLYPQKLVNLHVKSKKPLNEIASLDEELAKLEKEGIRHLIRYSGTENKLRVLLEGKDAEAMHKKMDEIIEFFKKVLNDI